MRRQWWLGVTVMGVCLLSCRTPTQITLVVETDVPGACDGQHEIGVTVARAENVEYLPLNLTSRECNYTKTGASYGTVVITPKEERDEEITIRVMMGVEGPVDTCKPSENEEENYKNCIVARRRLGFVPYTELTLPIMLRASCENKGCESGQTCVNQECKSAQIPDSRLCTGAGCDETVLYNEPAGGMSGAAGAGGSAGQAGMAGTGGSSGGPTCASGELGDGPQGPSCDGLLKTCGANANESCCRSLLVPGNATGSTCEGELFYRDNDASTWDYNTMNAPATISDYYLDRYEVTVGRFKQFVAAYDEWHITQGHPANGEGNHPHVPDDTGWDGSWSSGNCPDDSKPCLPANAEEFKSAVRLKGASYATWPSDDVSTGNDKRPINYVNWYEAFAFCLWDGGFLPTEAEWMYASSGGNEQRTYPWSKPADNTVIDASFAAYHDVSVYTGCNSDTESVQCIISVGTKSAGDGRWGHSDLGGNMWEWSLDAYNNFTNPCNNCYQNTAAIAGRVHRGGGWHDSAGTLVSPQRFGYNPYLRDDDLGFRCARTP